MGGAGLSTVRQRVSGAPDTSTHSLRATATQLDAEMATVRPACAQLKAISSHGLLHFISDVTQMTDPNVKMTQSPCIEQTG